MTLMTTDLDDAMKGLDWSLPQNNGNVLYGRVTKATAKHVRAQVAMWESDWDTAIEECEDIFKQEGIYSMEKKAENVFNSADLKSPEVSNIHKTWVEEVPELRLPDIVSLFRLLPESIKLQVVSIRPIRVDMVGDVFIRIPIY